MCRRIPCGRRSPRVRRPLFFPTLQRERSTIIRATFLTTCCARWLRKAALAEWEAQHPMPVTTLAQVADHVEHIRQVAGVDHVGLGSDFDGIPDAPVGLEGVDRYPALLAELMRRGWSDADIAKLAGENLLRALGSAEQVSLRLQGGAKPH